MLSNQFSEQINDSVGRSFESKVNCFSVSRHFFFDSEFQRMTADEMLNLASSQFEQVKMSESNALALIWSRSSFDLPIGDIKIQEIAKRSVGFPFGLILEHSFVQLENDLVYQKPDPKIDSKIEIIPFRNAIAPYEQLKGFEITWHRLVDKVSSS